MSRLFSSLVEFVKHAGLTLFANVLTVAVVIMIIVISWFWPPIYSFLESKHIFEALVLVMFIEVIALSTIRHEKNEHPTIFIEEIDAVNRLFKVVEEKRVRKVRILSAGLGSRFVMIEQLIKDGVSVQVLAQDPSTAIDTRDASNTIIVVQQLLNIAHLENSNCLFRLNVNVATVRAVLLYEPNDRARHLFIGWYTYGHRNTQLYGSHNPTLYVSSDSVSGRRLCDWVERLMASAENEARDIPDDRISSTTQDKT